MGLFKNQNLNKAAYEILELSTSLIFPNDLSILEIQLSYLMLKDDVILVPHGDANFAHVHFEKVQ